MLSGSRLGRYELKQKLGAGGMAEIWEAFDEQLHRNVALKVILPNISREPEFRERFQREARLAASLEHAHIVPIFDFGFEGEQAYIVTPILRGGSLRERFKEAVPLPSTIRWLSEIASALDHAHAQGILHRDVTPANILFDKNGRLFLCDFGLAKHAQGPSELTAAGMVIGTPTYISPEQAAGRPAGARSDQYALAVIAYRLLTGRLPFVGDSAIALLHMTLMEPAPAPSSINYSLPPGADDVLLAALAKNPEQRFESCSAFVAALARALDVTAATAAAPTGLPIGAFASGTPTMATPQTAARAGTGPTAHATGPTQRSGVPPPVPPTGTTKWTVSREPATMKSMPPPVPGAHGSSSPRWPLALAGLAAALAIAGALYFALRKPAPAAGDPGGARAGPGGAYPAVPTPPSPTQGSATVPGAVPTVPIPSTPTAETPTPILIGAETPVVPGVGPAPTDQPLIVIAPHGEPPAPSPVPTRRRLLRPTPAPIVAPDVATQDDPNAQAPPTRAVPTQPAPAGRAPDSTVATRRTVKINVDPTDARVFLDGRYIGISNDWDGHGGGEYLTFEAGTHRLRFAYPGRRDVIVEVRVSDRADKDSVEIENKLPPGSPEGSTGPAGKLDHPSYSTRAGVRLTIDPPDATVIVDGKEVGQASRYADQELALRGPAVHDLVFMAPGRKSKSVRVIVAPSVEKDHVTVKEKLKKE